MRGFILLIGVIALLGDEEAAIFIEGEGDGRGHQRLGSGSFEAKPFSDLERTEPAFGRLLSRGVRRNLFRQAGVSDDKATDQANSSQPVYADSPPAPSTTHSAILRKS